MARNQYMNEQYALRNQPINEISALLSGSQINNPNFVNTPNNQIPTTDVAGLINTRFSQDMDIYKQESANYNALMGGIIGHDGRHDEDVGRAHEGRHRAASARCSRPIPRAARRKKLPIYEYSYKHDPTDERHVGPMAQDVEKIDTRAVKTQGGIKYIDQDRVMGNILRVA